MSSYPNNNDRQPHYNSNNGNTYPPYNPNNRQQTNKPPYSPNKFTKPFNPNTINELRDKFIKIVWKDKGNLDWDCFKVLNTYYAYGDGWFKLLVIDNGNSGEKVDIPQEFLENPIFVRMDDIKYFMIITEK